VAQTIQKETQKTAQPKQPQSKGVRLQGTPSDTRPAKQLVIGAKKNGLKQQQIVKVSLNKVEGR